ncbi:phosphatase PAP2 family protein [Pseudopontixanthobacter vadosimaris]|uniref:phosphatase PAP2 family protein n=1 Tax=Pseudopontixanthobacter vadosimaris TaxID=2726450 RepID=UPI00147600BA|nr:phosphatase PAP2 family protein [Pseudopontixanthobacter vadosimaris]
MHEAFEKIMRLSLVARRELPWRYILPTGILALLGFLVIELWLEIAEGEARQLDRAILLLFRRSGDFGSLIGPAWLEQTMVDITTLGSATMLTLLTIASAGLMAVRGTYRVSAILIGAIASGSILVAMFKDFLERPRPGLVHHLVNETSMSFPSGHAANSAIVYLTIAVLFVRFERHFATKLFVLAMAASIVLAIGVSRVALGVHWPSDVLAGWMLGTGWACFWAIIVKLPIARIPEVLPADPGDAATERHSS